VPPFTSPAPCVPVSRADGYERRRPEGTLLHQLISEHWPRFAFVVREFDEYLRCGLLEHGLVQLECSRCGHELVLAFSCKRRGFCPSCLGRRMSDVAAHLVDEVLPEVPIRQWVGSLPWRLRAALGYDRKLCADVLRAFVGALSRSLRWRAKRALGLRSVDDALVGAVTFVQRADSALRLNVHFHTLALDGVYVRDEQGELQFHPLPEPTGEEVAQVAAWTHEALLRVLARHGRSLEGVDESPDAIVHDQPVLASCYAASTADLQLLGDAPGQRTDKLVRPVRLVPSPTEPLAEVGGVNIHAKVFIDGRDRKRLERVCRYIARPPLSQERLELHPDHGAHVEGLALGPGQLAEPGDDQIADALGRRAIALPMDRDAAPDATPGGLKLLRVMRRLDPAPPAVVVRGRRFDRVDDRLLNEALRLDAFSVLDEPVDLEQMLETLRRLIVRYYGGQWPGEMGRG